MATLDSPPDNEYTSTDPPTVSHTDMEPKCSFGMGNSKQKRKKSQWCSAINCKNERYECPGMSFFRFPRDEERCKKWVVNCRRQDLLSKTPSQLFVSNVLCGLHFEDSQFVDPLRRNRLKYLDAVPTLFDVPNPPSKCAISRPARKVRKVVAADEHSVLSPSSKTPSDDLPPPQSSVSTDIQHMRSKSTVDIQTIQLLKMAPEDERWKVLKQECLRLYSKFQHLKEIARIDLDLLSLCVDFEDIPEAKAEWDRVHELVQALLNEEVQYLFYPSDDELYEDDGQGLETTCVDSVDDALEDDCQGLETTCVDSVDDALEDDCQGLETTCVDSVDDTPVVKAEGDNKIQLLLDPFDEELYKDDCQGLETTCMDSVDDIPVVKAEGDNLEDNADDINIGLVVDVTSTEDSVKTNQPEASMTKMKLQKPIAAAKKSLNRSKKKDTRKKSIKLPISTQHLIKTDKPEIEKKWEKTEGADTGKVYQYKCERCGLLHNDKDLFNKHCQIHVKEDLTCTVCGKEFNTKYRLKIHTQLHSKEKPFVCDLCGKGFHVEYYLKTHLKRHNKSRPKVYCELCGKPFANRYSLSKHKMSQHSKVKLKCSFCDKEYRSIDALTSHEKQHSEHFPHQCSKCGVRFKNPTKLEVHERIHVGEIPVFTCSICDEIFSSKVERNAHKRDHLKNMGKPRNCSVCHITVKGSQAMAQHMLTHPDLQICLLCPLAFKSKLDLQSHVTTTHLEKNQYKIKMFKCSMCDEQFSTGAKLREHKATHSNTDPLKCIDCGKSFSCKATLKLHRNAKHLKTKQHQCEYCGRNFLWVANFRRHVQNHLGLKPWKCSVCGRGFSQKSALETHSWTHRADKRFTCEKCGRGFNEKRALLSHRKSQHQEQEDSLGGNDLNEKLDLSSNEKFQHQDQQDILGVNDFNEK